MGHQVTVYVPATGTTSTQSVQHVWITHENDRLDVTLHSDDTQHAPQGLRKRRTARDDPLQSEAQAWRPPLAGCADANGRTADSGRQRQTAM